VFLGGETYDRFLRFIFRLADGLESVDREERHTPWVVQAMISGSL
jgi:hypothetical protein